MNILKGLFGKFNGIAGGNKSFFTGGLLCVFGVAGYLLGDLTVVEAFTALSSGLGIIFAKVGALKAEKMAIYASALIEEIYAEQEKLQDKNK